jgi:antitoxin HigA-1
LKDDDAMMKRRPVHPGEILSEELGELGVSPTELARQIEVPPNRISQIINGKRDVSADTALRLAHWFGTSAQFWTNLQNQFDLAVAEERAGDAIAALPTKPEGGKDGEQSRFDI